VSLPTTIASYGPIVLATTYLVFLGNIVSYLLPLFRRKDDLLDIPLTPSQRVRLGLDPSLSSMVPSGQSYVTPPRYALNSSPASRSSAGGTPRSVSTGGFPSPSPLTNKLPASAVSGHQGRLSNSPFSPPTPSRHSPLGYGPFGSATPLGKGRDFFAHRRSSLGSPSLYESSGPVGAGLETPSPPVGGKQSSIAISNRWHYDRNRESSIGR
jgi:nucleoporin POM34